MPIQPAIERQVLACIPTYNERENLQRLIGAVHAVMPSADVLIIDDNSPDGTGVLADSIAARNSRVTVLHRSEKLGLGTAYVEGLRRGLTESYQFFFQMDCDFSHDPIHMPQLLRAVGEGGADVALGSRWIRGSRTENWPIGRRLISRAGSLYARAVLGGQIRDFTAGFKCFRRAVLERVPLDVVRTRGYGFNVEMTYRALKAGFKVVEVPITFVDRRAGMSKMSKAIFFEAMKMVWNLRFSRER